MNYSRFLMFNIGGAIGWVTLMVLMGYFLGRIPIVRQNFEKVILLVIFVSVLPPIIQTLKSRGGGARH